MGSPARLLNLPSRLKSSKKRPSVSLLQVSLRRPFLSSCVSLSLGRAWSLSLLSSSILSRRRAAGAHPAGHSPPSSRAQPLEGAWPASNRSLPPTSARARAQTKTFLCPRPLGAPGQKGEETRVQPAPSHVGQKKNERPPHPARRRTRTTLRPGGLRGKRGAGRRRVRTPRQCAGAVAPLGTLFFAEKPKGGAGV